jgi:hypothetical protein
MGRLACLVLTLSIGGGDGLDGETGVPCSDIIVGGGGLDGETGMPFSDIIYRGGGWIGWGDWHALF